MEPGKKEAVLSVTRPEPVLGGSNSREGAAVAQAEPDVTVLWTKHHSILWVTLLIMVHGAIKSGKASDMLEQSFLFKLYPKYAF